MSTVASPPPVRHGKCRLELTINGVVYTVRRVKLGVAGRHAKSWSLTKPDGTCHFVCREGATLSCSCPDVRYHGARCKHQRALVAAGLLCGRQSPSLRARAQGVSRV
jgi:hypothetical protein